jgi:galactonate dehydratase
VARTLELIESHVSARTRWHFLVLRDGDATAVGECSDAGTTAKIVERLIKVRPLLAQRDLLTDRGAIVEELTREVDTASDEDAFVAATVMGGLEQLLIDHAARADGEPVWKWLGGNPTDYVQLYANINRLPGGRTPSDVAGMARRAVAAGFTAIKCAPFDVREPGESLADTGLERLRAIREAVGYDIELKVDCHERLTADEVHQILPALEDLDIGWLEDAFAIHQTDDLRTLRSTTDLPLAGGELMFHEDEARTAIAERLIDVLMPDVKHAGGIERLLGIARAAPDLQISPHNPSGPVATAASAHLLAACPNATVLEYQFGETSWRSELVGGNEHIVDGRIRLSDSPGLGVVIQPGHPSCRVVWSTNL